MMRKSVLASLAATALLSGCISFGAELPPSLLTLTAAASAPAAGAVTASEDTAIAVLPFEATAKLGNTRVPVQVTDTQIAYLKDAIWVERPSRLFRRLVGETIRVQSGRMVVDGEASAIVPRTVLRGNLREFGYDARQSAVIVRFDAVRESGSGEVQTRRFEATETGVSAEAGPVGEALNRAANDVSAQIAAWVS